MDRFKLIFGLAAIFIGLFTTDIYAQRKIATISEYYKELSKEDDKYYEKSRREETTEETFSNSVVSKSVLRVYEDLPDRSRVYTKTTEDGKTSEFEQITIDYMQYTRKDGGTWTKVDLRQSGAYGTGSGSGWGSTRQCDQYSIEQTSINGKPVQLLERLTIDNRTDELMFEETRKWLGDDGLPYREEDVKGKLSPRQETYRKVKTYEYDPNIKIEAPIQ